MKNNLTNEPAFTFNSTRNNANLTVVAKDVITGEPIPSFRFIVNENNVGDPQVELPEEERDPSLFPSLKPAASHSPVVATGEASDTSKPVVSLPNGKYLVSVLAPRYKMGGNWVTMDGTDKILEVELHSNPLPLSKIRVHVFHDNNPVNGEDDVPLESGLEGFRIIIEDAVGEVTVDYFGNPLGTEYERDEFGNLILDSGNPVPIPGTGGKILTDENGDALIDNLPPGKYGVQAIPPDGTDWIQTTTIEGTHTIDAWIEEGNDGYSPREGFKMPLVWFGFVRPMEFGPPCPWETGTITGRVRTIIEFIPPFKPLTLGDPVDRPWIALSDIGANDQQVYTGRGDSNGNFTIEKVPPGLYQMAIWDEPLDYIISFRTVQVGPGETVDLGDIGIPRWYGKIKGTVFNDLDGNGVRDPGESGIPNVEVNTRFKDGSIQYSTITDMHGNYELKEVFELERFAVAEVGFTRFACTGATATPDYGTPVPNPANPAALCRDARGNYVRCSETHPGALTLAALTWAAKTNRIDWGKRLYDRGFNGGISGIVYYATMRNETDPRFAVAEQYEPGIPGVTINLYAAVTDVEGKVVQGDLINTVTTEAWEHPTGCMDPDGNPDENCTEVPNISNQIRPGVFDGGYAFETYWDPHYGHPGAVEKPLPSGTYIVEVVPPAGYKALDIDGSTNTDQGDEFVNISLYRMPPPPYLPTIPPDFDIHKKVVNVVEGMNATADFFLYTDVPVPGRIVGFLLDDVNLETDPNFIYFGEKRGILNTPVGIRDFTGRLITTVHSDINGIFEVLLPSTYTRNVPIPSGVVPGMYQVIGNDPGDPDQPNAHYNPNYQTLKLVFDVWPGKTTYADVALFPITAFVGTPGAQFAQPPQCNIPAGTPQIFRVSRVHADVMHPVDENRAVSITGAGFGEPQGKVTLAGQEIDILEWTDQRIQALVPHGFSAAGPGPVQLLVTSASGKTSPVGITFHILREGAYWPNIVVVGKEGGADYTTIQDAIDNEPDGTIVVVPAETYYESPILYKNIKLQGQGPGGVRPDGSAVAGSVIDGRFFLSYANQWLNKLAGIDFDGPALVPPDQVKEISRGQVLTVVAKAGAFSDTFKPQVDGFKITGARGEEGGGIYINAHCAHLVVSNNIIQSNGGGFGGGITIGKAYVGDNYNDNIRIHHNRILNNGGISLAGGIGIFNGADNYEIAYNDICGNYSAEYGGGISHYGYSPGGKIHHNRILFNASFDEGAGIFVGGEQPVPPETLTAGSGEVDIYNNLIQANLANDDGGGVRLLQPLNYRINIYNNVIVNNVSTDLGGGIALDDASNVVIANNTIAKNITTATAEDSDGLPHAAGLVSERHSAAFQAYLDDVRPGSPNYSDPVLFNNIFWDNRAGTFNQALNGGRGGISGIGAAGDPQPVNVMDLEVFGTPALLNPEYCSLSHHYDGGGNNVYGDPVFASVYDTEVTAVAFNMEPDFKSVKIVTVVPELTGDYHLTGGSTTVIDRGTGEVTRGEETFQAPKTDFDGNTRPQGAGYDIGAFERSI
ncbi:right-handed parallel beta-helix repeat-containing protein [Desulfallas sp. Bu1-1]|uniref:SdrD B-like domain-containing protein n=1 Tax=Desulfallas sp. Bu1-1 TaxID=2787620 RepID=UPI0018A01B7A|nr:SdrD B-like domain-containing protein [Desulfallas sp. Bu1-1]MBF7082303.1 right-handed parallel beta-helix repeat-containing protein [Desulfallas sp. Bu1-1]